MLVPRQEYSRELKIACMHELDSGKGMAEVARQYQLSPKRLETWKGEWRAKGELAFPGKGARPQARLDSERIAVLERKIGQQTMEGGAKIRMEYPSCVLGIGGFVPRKIGHAAEIAAGGLSFLTARDSIL